VPALEAGYRVSLKLRPALQRLAGACSVEAERYPRWLVRELRSNHAGETGAVAIYRGILAVTRDDGLRRFAARHMQTESEHLALMQSLVPPAQRSRLLPLWRLAGYFTGALPALFGPDAVYATIETVETFVDRHYAQQIEALDSHDDWTELRTTLVQCRQHEIEHRDEARGALLKRSIAVRVWQRAVYAGSHVGVMIARRL